MSQVRRDQAMDKIKQQDVAMNCSDCMDECSCLRVDKIKACHLKANCIHAECIVANDICSQKVQAVESWSDKSYNNMLCAQSASIDNLCVTNLKAVNFDDCNEYRAAAAFNADQVYNLGSPINWNVVVDDPNNNVSMAPFAYTVDADQAGYYHVNFHFDIHGLSGAGVITGVPVGFLTLLVNGNKLIDGYSPYLTFNDKQTAQLSALVLLNGGDVITMKYDVLVFDPNVGLMPFVGTVVAEGNGKAQGSSYFAIVKLSDMCSGEQPIICPPCPPVEIGCQPVSVPCC